MSNSNNSPQNNQNLVKPSTSNTSEYPEDVPKPKFLVDDNGHLIRRDRSKASSGSQTSFMEAPSTGSYGFGSFSPVGYNSRAERPNVTLKGVRPGMRETNPEAHQTLRKFHTDYTYRNKDLRKTYKDKQYENYSYQQPKPTRFAE